MAAVPDFQTEAMALAINEACAGDDVECKFANPCPECQALALSLQRALVKAFKQGQLAKGDVDVQKVL